MQMQHEFLRQQETSDQALRKALGKITKITQQYEREVHHRAGMELKCAELRHQLEEQHKELLKKHAQELEATKKEWEMERDTLVTIIQRDCSTAIDTHRRSSIPNTLGTRKSSLPESPTGVEFDFLTEEQPILTVDTTTGTTSSVESLLLKPSSGGGGSSSSRSNGRSRSKIVVSPIYSEIDEVLRETEDLIRSIA